MLWQENHKTLTRALQLLLRGQRASLVTDGLERITTERRPRQGQPPGAKGATPRAVDRIGLPPLSFGLPAPCQKRARQTASVQTWRFQAHGGAWSGVWVDRVPMMQASGGC